MKTFAWLLLCLAAPLAQAQPLPYLKLEQRLTAEQMQATGLDTLSPAQLQLLNQLLGEQAAAAPAAPPPAQARAQGREGAGADTLIGFNDQPIRSRLKGTVAGWEPGTVFQLENGQQWKVLKGQMRLSRPVTDPEILVVPGVAGRWFLQVHEDAPKARVYRID